MRRALWMVLAVPVLLSGGCRSVAPTPPPAKRESPLFAAEPVIPLPAHPRDQDAKAVALGERIFADARASADGTVSCASCHKLEHAGADDVPRSTGVHGRHPALKTPGIFNLEYISTFGWYGLTHELRTQIRAEFAADDHMGNDASIVAVRLAKDPEYADAFRDAFPGHALDDTAIVDALHAYLWSLRSPGAPGDAMVEEANQDKRDKIVPWAAGGLGYVEFKSFGCAACHQGMAVGANMVTKLTFEDALAFMDVGGRSPRDTDPLRFTMTHQPDDLQVVRVPSLRNVACTAPYFHDGSVSSIEEAVELEAIRQVGHPLNHEQVADIAAFLRTLTGSYRGKPL